MKNIFQENAPRICGGDGYIDDCSYNRLGTVAVTGVCFYSIKGKISQRITY